MGGDEALGRTSGHWQSALMEVEICNPELLPGSLGGSEASVYLSLSLMPPP